MLAVLLAVGGVAVARARDEAAKKPAQGWTEYPMPPPVPIDDGAVIREVPDPFTDFTTADVPRRGSVTDLLLFFGEPAFLVARQELPAVLGASGGPDHAPVLVGWCRASRTFQDASGRYVYDETGLGYGEQPGHLPIYDVRPNAQHLEVAALWYKPIGDLPGPRTAPPRCPEPLRYPRLPERADGVHDAIERHRVVRGRYVVTTESASFCAPVTESGCPTQGWETFGHGNLPPNDLAASYTWEGDFVVRGNTGGQLSVVRLPGTRLVARKGVGREAVRAATVEVVNRDPVTVRVTPGGLDIVLRDDADVYLGNGFTGLGKPRGTPATLVDYLTKTAGTSHDLWFVLDARGRAIRVVR